MNNYMLLFLSVMLIISAACTQQIDRLEQNKSLVISANNELLNNRNISFVDTVFAENYRNNGSEMGIESIKNFLSTLLNAFPDLQVTVEPILAEGDLVGWLRTHTGTHDGEIIGIPATGQQITWQTTVITRIVDGKVVEEWSSGNLQQKLQAVETEE